MLIVRLQFHLVCASKIMKFHQHSSHQIPDRSDQNILVEEVRGPGEHSFVLEARTYSTNWEAFQPRD